jgi:FAD/FMN-containing dehydrogenase
MIDRRRFLHSIAAAGAATAALGTRRARASPADALAGKVYFKGDARYEALRQAASFNARKPARFPNAIVLAEQEADVIAAVQLARERGWQVTTRSGGHSWTASHTRDNSVQINLARMQEMEIDPAAGVARISPSTYGNVLNRKLREDYRLFTPSAHGVNVGMGGFVMCGGHGWNSRVFGLGCANLLAVDVVTADGQLIHASEQQNSDYLWAARGSGPGFFGVATRYYQRLHACPPVMKSSGSRYGLEHFAPVVTWLRDSLPSFPRNLEVVLTVTNRDGQPAVTVAAACLGDTEPEVEAALALLGSCPVIGQANMRWDNRDRIVPYDVEPAGDVQPTGARFAVDNIWTNASAAQLLPHLQRICASFPSPQSSLFLQCWGPVQKLPDMAYSVQADLYVAVNATYYDPADDARCAAWVVESTRSMAGIAAGAQMNDENMALHPARYLSRNAERRLHSLRRKYDPQARFAGFMQA